MKKFLVIVSDLNLGGVTTSTINFCNELSSRGETVHFLNMGHENITASSQLSNAVKQIRIDGGARRWKLDTKMLNEAHGVEKLTLYPLAVLKKLTNRSELWLNIIFHGYCLPEEYDAVVAFRQCAPCYYFAQNCVKAKKKIGFIHGALDHMGDISTWDRYFGKFDKIACVSKACCEGFQRKYTEERDKFTYIYNMFSIEKIRCKATEKPSIFFSSDTFNIVTVSRVENKTKGTDRIARICKLLKNEGLSFHWYLIGDGPDMESLIEQNRELATEDVLTLCGAYSNPHTFVFQADLSVLPTHTEAYSMTVIESLIVGTPILVTRYPGAEEAIQDGVNGFIVDQDENELFEKIRECILNREILITLNENISSKCISNDCAINMFYSLMD